ncbi:hypothetical protein DAMA08_029710 [Martiniozyma asiatica (nom. inval.)]|nr:hypothetical protein DAMA08_029710 [Martiniozyma asiatica]
MKRSILEKDESPARQKAFMLRYFESNTHYRTVKDYKDSIHEHLCQLEVCHEEVHALPYQTEVRLARSFVLNSFYDVCFRMGWSTSTFSLSVHLFDCFTSQNQIDISKCALVGFCCLWIASKYNENKPKGKILNALLKRAGYDASHKAEFLTTEFEILKYVDWDLSHATSESFVDMYLDINDPNLAEKRHGSIFLCELAEFDLNVLNEYQPSEIASSATLITNCAWKNLRHKHIRQHKFHELDTLLLRAIIDLQPSIRSKYLNHPRPAIQNLICLAHNFFHQQQTESQQQLQNPLPVVNDSPSFNYLASPAASPTFNPYHTYNYSYPYQTPLTRLPTPGTTPTSTFANSWITPAPISTSQYTPLPRYFDEPSPIVEMKPRLKRISYRHHPVLTRSKIKDYARYEGCTNEIAEVLLNQQLPAYKKRRL